MRSTAPWRCTTLSHFDTTGFVNPQFSISAVEDSASQVVGSFPSVNGSASPVYKQVHQEQIAAEQESVERVQQLTVEQIVHVPIPQIQEQIVESVQVIPRELFPERIEEQIVDIPVPPTVKDIEELVQIITQERSQQRTVNQLVGAPKAQVVEEQLVAEETTQFLDEPSSEEPSALEFLQNIIHETPVEVDRCVLVLRREKEKLRLLEECSFVPPRDLAELRRHIQTGKDAIAVAMHDLHACREQSDLWRRRRISNPDTPHPFLVDSVRDGNRLPRAVKKISGTGS